MSSLTCSSVLKGPDTAQCLSLNNKLLAAGFENGSIYLSPRDDLPSPIVLSPSSESCSALAFSSYDSNVLYSSYGGNIVSWDVRKYQTPLNVWKVCEDEVNCIDFNVSDNLFAIADDLGHVSLVSATSGTVSRIFKDHDNICSAALFRPSWQNQLISAGLDCRLVVNDWKGGGHKPRVFEMTSLMDPLRYATLLVTNSGGSRTGRKKNKTKKSEASGPVRVSSCNSLYGFVHFTLP